ncbi:MAG TPA: NUDIX domain-containing protein [Anaerolineae bacterium]|jgi:ADP-ribose pyrophosphatase YjhB (NUDIX family)
MTWSDWTGQPVTRTPDRLGASVSAVIFDAAGSVLLMHRTDNQHWGIPGGNIEIGESVTQAVIREVAEETGLDVTVERLIGVYSDPAIHMIARYPGGNLVHYVNLCFLCSVHGGILRGSDEGHEVAYFPVSHLPDQLLLSHHPRIQDALANQPAAFVR